MKVLSNLRLFGFSLLCHLLLGSTALAKAADIENKAEGQQRSRIALERVALDSKYTEEEALCFQRFAVNDCLGRVRNLKRDALSDLRRQEISINLALARARASDQLVRNEARFTPQALQDESKRLLEAQASQAERLKNMGERIDARARASDISAQRISESKERMRRSAEAAQERSAKFSEAMQNRKEYDERVAASKVAQKSAQNRVKRPQPAVAKP